LQHDGAYPGRAGVERLRLEASDQPLAIGTVVITPYRPGAQRSPTRLSPARGALAMVANTLAAVRPSQEATRVIAEAIDGAVILEGERGETRQLVRRLLNAATEPSHND
jgi:hypothetical protein